MCGIVGYISRHGNKKMDMEQLTRVRDTMIHRGPDDAGARLFDDGLIGLAHRRLSIIDLSSAGHEPMSYLDGRYWLTFNGEIYNFIELRSELGAKGCYFRSDCDAEVILAAYSVWGTECVTRFNGMWAFAIWDTKEKILFCSRDRFGIKPFYYFDDGNLFIFASEIRAIISSGFTHPEPQLEAIATYLNSGLVDGLEETFFKGILRLMPAHSLLISKDTKKIWQYWDVPVAGRDSVVLSSDVEQLKNTFADAVGSHMVSDAPVGVSLSGGMDSSSIFALASRFGENKIKGFCAYYEKEHQYDERYYFNIVADAYSADKHLVLPDKNQVLDILPKIIWHLEEPPSAHGIYPRWHIVQLASNYVKVLLGGQGGDELFAGYQHYYRYFFWDSIIKKDILRLLKDVHAMAKRKKGLNDRSTYKKLLHRLTEQLRYIFYKNKRCYPYTALSAKGDKLSTVFLEQKEKNKNSIKRGYSWLNERLYYDVFYGILPTLLKYDDKIGMAFSIECRIPFLDYRLVELAFSLSPFAKIQNGWSKSILRYAMKGLLPKEILWRSGKTGFPMPFSEWFKGELLDGAEAIIMDSGVVKAHYLDRKKLETYIAGHRNGRHDISRQIWHWLCLSIWLDMHTKLTDTNYAAKPR